MKTEISTFLISLYLINDLFNNYHNSHYRALYSLQSLSTERATVTNYESEPC